MQMITGEAVQIEIKTDAQPPMMKMEMLREAVDDFEEVWKHAKTKRTADWTMSEFEFSLTNHFVAAGWTDQEICDALVFHRNYYEPNDPKGKNRADRIAQTIGKVRATTQHQHDQRVEEQQREEATDQLAAVSGEAGLDPVVTISLFNRVIGGPEVKEFIQNGRDPDTTRYTMLLANGDEIPIGPTSNLLSQDKFRERFAAVTRHLPKRVKNDKWDQVVQALLDAAQVREGVEDTRSHRAVEWLRSYADRRVSSDRDLACQAYDPFTFKDQIHVPLGPFHQYLRKVRGERIAEVDLKQYLEAAGFERKTVNYTRENGNRSTRSYFVSPLSILSDEGI
jgi:hypothetical protein